MEELFLQCKKITKVFHSRNDILRILNGIDFSLRRSETVCIQEKSGAGKSVFLSLLSGLSRPTSGEIIIKNRDLNALSTNDLSELRRQTISVIFQNYNLVSYWTALENVEAAYPGADNQEDEAKALLVRLGLERNFNSFPGELSMGEQQRVALARTLIKRPELIIADEPTSEVDDSTAAIIVDLLLREVSERNAALIVATHGCFPVKRADKLYTLKDGKLLP